MRIVEQKVLAKLVQCCLADSEIIAPVESEGRLYFQLLDSEQGLVELVWPEAGDSAPPEDPLTVNSIKEFF
ncbi:unnamed protein product, partial [marine sediment metagenome]